MKRKFSTIEDCIHAYAQFSQDQGESGNVFFYGNTLYSYGHHFPLAHKTQNDKGQTAVLLNGRTYSNSTTRHQGITQAATRQYNQIISFGLDRYSGADQDGHQRNETHYIREFETIARNLATARKPAKYIFQAQTLNAQYCLYTDFFALTPSPEYQTAFKNATEASEEIRQQMKAYQAEERKRKAAKAIEEAKAMGVKIQEWITGERQSLYPRPKIDILRRSGDQVVETSQGVKMTIQEAKAIYLQLVRHELKAGDQVLDRYTVSKVNGTVTIGCHTFDTAYLLKFGEELTGIHPAIVEMQEDFKAIKKLITMNENVEFTAYGVVRQGNAKRQAHIVAIFSSYTEAEKANNYFNTTPSNVYKVEEINIFKKTHTAMKSEYLKARTAGMTASEKRKYLKFDSLCKQASKCRESRRQISCYSCPLFDGCNIQQEMKKVQP